MQGGVVRGSPANTWITVDVIDTGIGIARADQADIWQEFHQVDGSLSRRYEGTGLGLAIVRRLVMMLGGSIELESDVGKGSRFTFTIPAAFAIEQPYRRTIASVRCRQRPFVPRSAAAEDGGYSRSCRWCWSWTTIPK